MDLLHKLGRRTY